MGGKALNIQPTGVQGSLSLGLLRRVKQDPPPIYPCLCGPTGASWAWPLCPEDPAAFGQEKGVEIQGVFLFFGKSFSYLHCFQAPTTNLDQKLPKKWEATKAV